MRCSGIIAALGFTLIVAIAVIVATRRDGGAATAHTTAPCEITVDAPGGGSSEIREFATGRITRWYGPPRPARARVMLSAAELDTLCAILESGHFFDLPTALGGNGHFAPAPPTIHFSVRLGGRTKELWWTPDWDPSVRGRKPGPDPRQDFLFEFSRRSDAMLARRAAYRSLPRGRETL